MTSLLERSGKVLKLVEQFKNVNSTAEAIEHLRTRDLQVSDIRESLDQVDRHRKVLAAVGAAPGSNKKAPKALITKCQVLTDLVEKDWEDFARDASFSGHFRQPCVAISEASMKALAASWRAYAERLMATVPKDLLAGVGHDELGQKVRKAFSEAKALAEEFPADSERARDLAVLIERVVSMLRDVEKIPESVRVFLEKASSQGASLEDLTDEVRAWLSKRDRLGQLRILLT